MKKVIYIISLILLISSCSLNNNDLKNEITQLKSDKLGLSNEILELKQKINKNSLEGQIETDGTPLKGNETITSCKLSLWSTLVIENGTTLAKVDRGTQDNPMELIFSGINTDNVVLKGNQGETELLKIDNGDVIYLLERTGAGYVNIFSYFTKTGNIIFSKQYNLLGTTYGTQLIGYCN